jgi:hypothetical protein
MFGLLRPFRCASLDIQVASNDHVRGELPKPTAQRPPVSQCLRLGHPGVVDCTMLLECDNSKWDAGPKRARLGRR